MNFEWDKEKDRENSMKQPKKLKIDKTETAKIRKKIAKKNSIKITINIDSKNLEEIKTIAQESGIPYQRLINRFLEQSLSEQKSTESRLDKIERELRNLKNKVA